MNFFEFLLERKEKGKDVSKKKEGEREVSLFRVRGSVFEKTLSRFFLVFLLFLLVLLVFFSFFVVVLVFF